MYNISVVILQHIYDGWCYVLSSIVTAVIGKNKLKYILNYKNKATNNILEIVGAGIFSIVASAHMTRQYILLLLHRNWNVEFKRITQYI